MTNEQAPTNTKLPDPSEEPVCSVVRAGQILGISRSTAYAAVNDGEIPSIRLGRRLVVPTAHLLRMLGLDYKVDDAA